MERCARKEEDAKTCEIWVMTDDGIPGFDKPRLFVPRVPKRNEIVTVDNRRMLLTEVWESVDPDVYDVAGKQLRGGARHSSQTGKLH